MWCILGNSLPQSPVCGDSTIIHYRASSFTVCSCFGGETSWRWSFDQSESRARAHGGKQIHTWSSDFVCVCVCTFPCVLTSTYNMFNNSFISLRFKWKSCCRNHEVSHVRLSFCPGDVSSKHPADIHTLKQYIMDGLPLSHVLSPPSQLNNSGGCRRRAGRPAGQELHSHDKKISVVLSGETFFSRASAQITPVHTRQF